MNGERHNYNMHLPSEPIARCMIHLDIYGDYI